MKTLKLFFACFLVIGLLGMSAQADLRIVPDEYPTIQAAVNAANSGDTIMVAEGEFAGAKIDNVLKEGIEIIGSGNGTVITSGPDHPYPYWKVGFLVQGVPGVKISNFKIVCESSWPPSPGSMIIGVLILNSDNTKVSHLLIETAPMEGINIFGSNQCEITHNTVIGAYFGAGINLWNAGPAGVGAAGQVTKNLVAFNKIENSANGISLRANYENYVVTDNDIKHNKINNPNANGLILEDIDEPGEPEPEPLYLSGNEITFNDFRGTADPPECTIYEILLVGKEAIETNNTFTRNLGYCDPNKPNRGQSPHSDAEYLELLNQ